MYCVLSDLFLVVLFGVGVSSSDVGDIGDGCAGVGVMVIVVVLVVVGVVLVVRVRFIKVLFTMNGLVSGGGGEAIFSSGWFFLPVGIALYFTCGFGFVGAFKDIVDI